MTDCRLVIFAGPNGSGKSTITTPDMLVRFGIPEDRYINADEIAREMSRSLPLVTQREREKKAFLYARELRKKYRDERRSFAFETVFSHPSTLLDIAKCRVAGFEVILLFVTTDDPAINAARIARRVQSGGHDVPGDRIQKRYERTMALLPRIVESADRAFLFDNTHETPIAFAVRERTALPASVPVPLFLQQRLFAVLQRRHTERQAILQHLGITVTPDEESGIYDGRIVWQSDYFFVQEVEGAQIQHDRLLSAADLTVGNIHRITYRDGVGSVSGEVSGD
jgi:predicted ABC-type ATPase